MIPYNTRSVGASALYGCTSLTKIVVHGDTVFSDDLIKNQFSGSTTPFRGSFYVYRNSIPANFAYNKGFNRVFYKMNNDDRIDTTDASQILSVYAQLSTGKLSAAEAEKLKVCADVDRSGSINAIDASAVLSYYAKISTSYKDSFEVTVQSP